MKKFLSLLAASFALVLGAFADTETVDGITWTYTVSDDGKVSVGGGNRNTPAVSTYIQGAITIPSTLGGRPVTSIGEYAFFHRWRLTSVTIPDSVRSIGNDAFYYCSGLTSVTIPDSVTSIGRSAFVGCSGLTNMVFTGTSITSAWRGGDMPYFQITSVRISDSVTSIGGYAFEGCSGLTSVTIPDSVTSVGEKSFSGCSGLTSVTIGNGVTSIGDSAFYGCSGLTSVTIPDSVTSIEYRAFYGCSGLTSVTIPGSVTSIKGSAFYDCSGLTNMMFNGNAPSMGRDVFYGVSEDCVVYVRKSSTGWGVDIPGTWNGLKIDYSTYLISFDAQGGDISETMRDVLIGANVGELPTPVRDGYTFLGWFSAAEDGELVTAQTIVESDIIYYAHWRKNCEFTIENGVLLGITLNEDTEVVIPNTVTSIGDSAFENCSGLASVTIPDSVTNIGDNAFYGCTGLTKVILGAGVEAVSLGVFALCGEIKEVDLASAPAALKEMFPDSYANIETVILRDGITSLPKGFFDGCDEVENLTMPSALYYLIGYNALPVKVRETFEYGDDGFMIYQGWVLGYDDESAEMLTLPEVVGIGGGAFEGFGNLEAVTIPETVKYICDGAFRNCYYLDNVAIPDSVETIGDEAFKNCTEMQTITFGSGLKTVGDSAFENCISLSKVEFAEGLVTLGDRAFAGPMRLMSASLPASLEHIGEGVFSGSIYITGATASSQLATMMDIFPDSYTNIASVVVPDGVTNAVDRFFAGCSALTGVTMPDTLLSIGECAFSNCQALAEVGLPNSVTNLGAGAFSCCTNLHTVALSKNLADIQDRTFEKCPMLDSLVIPASVARIGSNIYSGENLYISSYYYRPFTESLTGVYFLGNAPEMADAAYAGMPSGMKSYVVKGSTGWYIEGAPTLPPGGWPTSNTRGITYWTPNQFEVTFDGNGGTPATYSAVQITDTTYSLPKVNPTRAGYRFDGWWTERTAGAQVTPNTRVTLTKEHTLYAHWQRLSTTLEIIFNANGGTVIPGSADYPVGATYVSLPVPTRIGHRFLGWFTSQVGGELVTEGTKVTREDNELYAHWEPVRYVVRFDANGGRGHMDDQTHTYNEARALSASTFERLGYAFIGWGRTSDGGVVYADEESVINLREQEGDVITLYAIWDVATYAVRFDGNGGSGMMDNQTMQIGFGEALEPCAFTYDGYEFAGWGTTYDGEAIYGDCEVVTNLTTIRNSTVTLYAIWALEALRDPVITPPDGFVFTGDSCEVEITCATKDAVIYYSTSGTPRLTEKYRYTEPFTITDTATIKAVAVRGSEKSNYVTAKITKRTLTLADALGVGDGVVVTTGGDGGALWSPIIDETAEGGISAKSGAIGDGEETWLQLSFSGAGTLSYQSKVSCEHDDSGDCEWDSLMVYVDGEEKRDWRIDGETGWLDSRSIEFATLGEHTVKWIYHKDEEADTSEGEDCAWIANVVWVPSESPDVDAIPEVADDAGVANALAGSADESRLAANITTKAEYDEYREWAGVKATHEAVRDSAFAWTAFALDAPAMISRTDAISEDDIEIVEIVSRGDDGAFTLEVGLKDVEIGDEAASERLLKVFGISGAAELDDSKFSDDNVILETGEPVDGKVKLTARPKDAAVGDGKSFFMRVRVNR